MLPVGFICASTGWQPASFGPQDLVCSHILAVTLICTAARRLCFGSFTTYRLYVNSTDCKECKNTYALAGLNAVAPLHLPAAWNIENVRQFWVTLRLWP